MYIAFIRFVRKMLPQRPENGHKNSQNRNKGQKRGSNYDFYTAFTSRFKFFYYICG